MLLNELLIKLVLINLVLILKLDQINCKFEKFNCDSSKELNELTKSSIKRLININGQIHLFLKNKVIRFNKPFIEKAFIFATQAYIQTYEEQEMPNYNIIGSHNLNVANGTRKSFDIVRNTDFKLDYYEIKLDMETGKLNKTKLDVDTTLSDVIYEITNGKPEQVRLASSYQSASNKTFVYIIYLQNSECRIIYGNFEKPNDYMNLELDSDEENTEYAIYYVLRALSFAPYFLFEIDNDLKTLNIHRFSGDFKKTRNFKESKIQEVTLKLDYFFGCINVFKEPSEVKGIFYNKGTFYVFINKFYLRIDDSKWLDKGCYLNDELYSTAKSLKFEDETVLEHTFFEINQYKFLKETQTKTYFFLPFRLFEIEVKEDKSLILKELKNNYLLNLFQLCVKSTYSLNSELFCHNPKQIIGQLSLDNSFSYSSTNQNLNEINLTSTDHFDTGQSVPFSLIGFFKDIFRQKDDKVQKELVFRFGFYYIFMNLDYFYLFDYRKISSNEDLNSFKQDHFVSPAKTNCLFKKENCYFNWKLLIFILSIISFIILIVILFYKKEFFFDLFYQFRNELGLKFNSFKKSKQINRIQNKLNTNLKKNVSQKSLSKVHKNPDL